MKRRSRALFLVTFSVLVARHQRLLTAQTPQAITGQWTLNLGKRTLFVLTLEPRTKQSGPITGSLSRPVHFSTPDGVSFSDVEGPTENGRIVASSWQGDILSFKTENPKDASEKTTYNLTLEDQNHV